MSVWGERSDGESVPGERSDGESVESVPGERSDRGCFCVDVDALQRLSRSLHADAEVLAAVDVTAMTDRTAAGMPGSATATAAVALAHPIHLAHDRIASRLHEMAAAIEHHFRTCVESDLTAAQR